MSSHSVCVQVSKILRHRMHCYRYSDVDSGVLRWSEDGSNNTFSTCRYFWRVFLYYQSYLKIATQGASLVAQWLRNACQCRGHGFEPWSGKIPRAAERLGPWATITEPARLEPVLRSRRGRDSERPAHRDEEWPPLATAGGSPRTETKTQHSHK